jgi:hypothetical protein
VFLTEFGSCEQWWLSICTVTRNYNHFHEVGSKTHVGSCLFTKTIERSGLNLVHPIEMQQHMPRLRYSRLPCWASVGEVSVYFVPLFLTNLLSLRHCLNVGLGLLLFYYFCDAWSPCRYRWLCLLRNQKFQCSVSYRDSTSKLASATSFHIFPKTVFASLPAISQESELKKRQIKEVSDIGVFLFSMCLLNPFCYCLHFSTTTRK